MSRRFYYKNGKRRYRRPPSRVHDPIGYNNHHFMENLKFLAFGILVFYIACCVIF